MEYMGIFEGDNPDAREAGMSDIHWKASYLTGHPFIDRQHQGLFQLLGELELALQQARGDEVLWELLAALGRQVHEHFRCEERLMREQNYPLFGEHKQHHDEILREGVRLLHDCRTGAVRLGEGLPPYLQKWAHQHVVEDDARLADFLRKCSRQ